MNDKAHGVLAVNYATDGHCHNAEPGYWNHECGKAATWVGTTKTGFSSGFCDQCKRDGHESRAVVAWQGIQS